MDECSNGGANNIELVSEHQSKINKIKNGIPDSVLRLFGVLPKKKKNKKEDKKDAIYR